MIIILADLGSIRAFRVVANVNQTEVRPVLKEMEVAALPEPPQRLGETVSDQAGRFRSDGSPGAVSGEAHGLALEQERRCIVDLADAINSLVKSEGVEKWALAAPQPINARLVEALDSEVCDRLAQNLKTNLGKQSVLEIQERFDLRDRLSLFDHAVALRHRHGDE